MVDIKETGEVYNFDEEGYLICSRNESMIQEKWLEPLRYIVDQYEEQFCDEIHSIYVRGSVARGEAFDNVSDIDLTVVIENRTKTNVSKHNAFNGFCSFLNNKVKENYPFVYRLECVYYLKREILQSRKPQLKIKHCSICIFGEDLRESLIKFKKDEISAIWQASADSTWKNISSAIKHIEHNLSGDLLRWLSKRIIRCGFMIVYSDLNVWTRDIYQCYKIFCSKYPDKEAEIRLMMEVSISPQHEKLAKSINNSDKIIKFAKWLVKEYKIKKKN